MSFVVIVVLLLARQVINMESIVSFFLHATYVLHIIWLAISYTDQLGNEDFVVCSVGNLRMYKINISPASSKQDFNGNDPILRALLLMELVFGFWNSKRLALILVFIHECCNKGVANKRERMPNKYSRSYGAVAFLRFTWSFFGSSRSCALEVKTWV